MHFHHPVLDALIAYMVFSNLVDALPAPTENSGQGYRFIYRFAHGMASNILYAVKAKFPQINQFVDTGNHADSQQAGK